MAHTTDPSGLVMMEDPGKFAEGFNWKTVIGAFFVGLVMMPASIYISLLSGETMGTAAQWVTIILFAEIARRSISVLSKQEIYVLYHVAGGLVGGGAFAGLIWNQFLRQSRQAVGSGIANLMPVWACPPSDSPAILLRQFWHHDWWPALGLVVLTSIFWRLNWFGLGYALYKLTSDVERLPFPLARIAAEGATALAEAPDKSESWRWRMFSLGSMVGLFYALIYIGIPSFTGIIMTEPLKLLPIPWIDFTSQTESVLPAAFINFSFDLGAFLWGMVLPFWMVVGQFIACLLTSVFGNPILQHFGFFPSWRPGMGIISTNIVTQFDLWLSFGIGTSLAVASIGLAKLVKLWRQRKDPDAVNREVRSLAGKGDATLQISRPVDPKDRGDFPLWISIAMFIVSTTGYILLCQKLVPNFPLPLLIIYGFIWTPLTSYISARMIGITGQGVNFPFVQVGSYILSGYKGVDIWFAPIPMFDLGGVASFFKQMELTRTRLNSIIKAELVMLPIGLICSFVFWSFFWMLSAIPSNFYAYVDMIWPLNAVGSCMWMSATLEGRSFLLEAFKPPVIAGGFGFGLALYWALALFKAPLFLFYGFLSGIASFPNGILMMFLGALACRYHFNRKYGAVNWARYTPVLAAGFSCGYGLVAMLAVGVMMIVKSVTTKPF